MTDLPEELTIGELPAAATPARDFFIPVFKSGVTGLLTVGQILDLVIDDELADLEAAIALALADKASLTDLAGKLGIVAQTFTAVEKRQARANIDAVGNIFKRTIVASSDAAWAFDADTKFALVEVIGGGGSGGGAPVAGSLNVAAGSGGQAGGRSSKVIARPASGVAAIVIGAGASGVSGGNGAAGGTSSYSDGTNTLTAPGGAGGLTTAATGANVNLGAHTGTLPTGGDMNAQGEAGGNGFAAFVSPNAGLVGGKGGSIPGYGRGGQGSVFNNSVTGQAAGNPAVGYGAGGGGGVGFGSNSAVAGGAGMPGVVIITEFR